jgi:protein-S-isoprenylcysteine O-methyltransferase Ste14
MISPQLATILAFALWVLSWAAAAFWSAPAAGRPAFREERLYRIVTFAGAFLLFAVYGHSFHGRFRLWDLGQGSQWALFAIAVAGLLFAWWARLYLGRLWSGSVTRKADHHVVDTGPYAIVRHPIYTGIIVAIAAAALEIGTFVALAGFVLMALGFWIKARLEERFLREQLGAEAYDSYRRRVPMLVPFGPKSG